jgi:hypothetical protein
MKRNLSNTDRIIRVLIAALFGYLYFSGIVTGARDRTACPRRGIPATSVVAFCPLYAPFKLSTYKG